MTKKYGFIALLVPAVLAAACQKLDSGLVGGAVTSSKGGTGGSSVPITTGAGGTNAPTGPSCPTLRMQAHDILETNCSICHQAPGMPALYSGNFNFILDLAQLTSSISPMSSTTLTLKYVVKGKPDQSYIYRRISENSMPPENRTQRPTTANLQVLNQWITRCIDDATSPQGWPAPTPRADAGVDSGPLLENCGPANVCPEGGCCVFNQCRPNGTSCGPLPNPIPGQRDLPGFPGTCTAGSCQNMAGDSCGKVGEPCCDLESCTASQSSCLTTDLTMCSQCGGTGEACCKFTNCLDGRTCVGGGVGRVGTCELCGALGQPCCGSGVAALRMCDDTLTCVSLGATVTVCTDGSDGGA